MHFSSRHFSFKRQEWIFGKSTDEEIARMIERKVYWQTRLVGGDVWLGDEADALYLESTTDHVAEVAASLMKQGLFTMARRYATALPSLMDQGDRFDAEMAEAVHRLEHLIHTPTRWPAGADSSTTRSRRSFSRGTSGRATA